MVTIILLFGVVSCSAPVSPQNGSGEQSTKSIQHVSQVSWAHFYATIKDLSAEADLIVVGRVKGVVEETSDVVGEARWEPVILYFTDFIFSVEQVLKGHENVREVVIHQTGAVGKDEIRDDPLLEPGDSYVLFMHEYETGRYFILGGPQGRFQIIGDKVFSMNNVLPGIVFLAPDLDVRGVEKEIFVKSVIASIE
jgi:hypothetical protein